MLLPPGPWLPLSYLRLPLRSSGGVGECARSHDNNTHPTSTTNALLFLPLPLTQRRRQRLCLLHGLQKLCRTFPPCPPCIAGAVARPFIRHPVCDAGTTIMGRPEENECSSAPLHSCNTQHIHTHTRTHRARSPPQKSRHDPFWHDRIARSVRDAGGPPPATVVHLSQGNSYTLEVIHAVTANGVRQMTITLLPVLDDVRPPPSRGATFAQIASLPTSTAPRKRKRATTGGRETVQRRLRLLAAPFAWTITRAGRNCVPCPARMCTI